MNKILKVALIVFASVILYISFGGIIGTVDFLLNNTKMVTWQLGSYIACQAWGIDTSWWWPVHAFGPLLFEMQPTWGLMNMMYFLVMPAFCVLISYVLGRVTHLRSWWIFLLLNFGAGILLISATWDLAFMGLVVSNWSEALRTGLCTWLPLSHPLYYPAFSGISFTWSFGLMFIFVRYLGAALIVGYVLLSELGMLNLQTLKQIISEALVSLMLFLVGSFEIYLAAVVTNNIISPYFDVLHHFTDYFGVYGFFGWSQDFLRYHIYEFFTQGNTWTLFTFIVLLLVVALTFYVVMGLLDRVKQLEQNLVLRLGFLPLIALIFFWGFCFQACPLIPEYYNFYMFNTWEYVAMVLFWISTVGIPLLISKVGGKRK